jgi:hypothetical protein
LFDPIIYKYRWGLWEATLTTMAVGVELRGVSFTIQFIFLKEGLEQIGEFAKIGGKISEEGIHISEKMGHDQREQGAGPHHQLDYFCFLNKE